MRSCTRMAALAVTMSGQISTTSPVVGGSSSGSPTRGRMRPPPAPACIDPGSGVSAVPPSAHQEPGQGKTEARQQEREALQQRCRLQVLLLHLQLQEGDAQASYDSPTKSTATHLTHRRTWRPPPPPWFALAPSVSSACGSVANDWVSRKGARQVQLEEPRPDFPSDDALAFAPEMVAVRVQVG